MRRRSKTFM